MRRRLKGREWVGGSEVGGARASGVGVDHQPLGLHVDTQTVRTSMIEINVFVFPSR